MSAQLLSRRHAIGLTLAGASALAAPALAKGPDIARTIDRLVREALGAGARPGFQVAIQRHGRPILVASYGIANLEFNAPVRDDTAFRIASLTKQFTAAALLKLQEEGKLSVDDRLDKYFPRFPRGGEVTLYQLAHHTSGIHNYLELPDYLADVMVRRNADAQAAFFAKMPSVYDFAPGTRWHYSNSAYILLGGVIEKASGQSLEGVLHSRFFAPLGMTHTAVDDELVIVPGRAAGYDDLGNGRLANAGYLSVIATGGAGSIRSTATDLLKWSEGVFGGKVLNTASMKARLEPGRLVDGSIADMGSDKQQAPLGYGYGVGIYKPNGKLKIGHSGGIWGFNTYMCHYPDDGVSIVVLHNCAKRGAVSDLVQKIESALFSQNK